MKPIHLVILSIYIVSVSNSCNSDKINSVEKRRYNDSYTGSNLNKVAFPIGGIGAGMFCLEGTGAISHMSVRNRPEIYNEPCMFAAISLKGFKNGVKVLEGQVPDWKIFGAPGTGRGSRGMSWGFPRFANAKFLARFPFAYIELEDKELPLKVQLTGWSPFIPTDADNSSLPVGAIEYSFMNTSNSDIEVVFSYNSKNFMRQSGTIAPGTGSVMPRNKASIKPIPNGFVLSKESSKEAPYDQGDFAIFTNESNTVVDYCWFTSGGGVKDDLTMPWNTISHGEVRSKPANDTDAIGA